MVLSCRRKQTARSGKGIPVNKLLQYRNRIQKTEAMGTVQASPNEEKVRQGRRWNCPRGCF